jgi:hypothetical protein
VGSGVPEVRLREAFDQALHRERFEPGQPPSQLITGQYLVQLRKLAAESGGRFFSIESVAELDGIYRTLEEELRAQYLLVYPVPEGAGEGFRRVEVKVAGHGRHA